jgi:hypothetical protein
VDPNVVRQLSRLRDARVEGLARPVDAIPSPILEEFPAAVCKRYECRPGTANYVWHCSHQPEPTQVRKVLLLRCGTAILLTQIRGRNDAKCAGGSERSHL